jgi:tRNA-dihydrouridine synthase C
MALNAQRAKELGAFGVDINFGCPAKTVNKHDGGATLLKKPDRLFQTIQKVKESVGQDFHVSAKVRLGFSDKSLVKEIAQACSEAKASWMTVHARTKEEAYRPPAHWRFIAMMKESSTIPIFANGDIWSLKDYKSCMIESGCEDVMIGRGLLRNPFLAKEIKNNEEFEPHFKETETIKMIIDYINKGPAVYGKLRALNRVKQWLRMCTFPSYPYFNDIFDKAKRAKTLDEILSIIKVEAH